MEKKFAFVEQKEIFDYFCKLIELKHEYRNYTGKEKWAIITDLTENELFECLPDVIEEYIPFVLLSIEQGKVIKDSYRNEDKYEKRKKRSIDIYGYDEERSSQFHSELSVQFCDLFEIAEKEQMEREKEELRLQEIEKVRKTLSLLHPIQRKRLVQNICCNLSSRTIAKQEGVNYSSVDKSIIAAKKNFKKIFENL